VVTAICKVRNPAHVIPTGLSEHIVETTYFDQTSIVSYTMFDTFPTIRSPLSKVISKKCHHPMLVQSKWDLGSSLDMDLPFSIFSHEAAIHNVMCSRTWQLMTFPLHQTMDPLPQLISFIKSSHDKEIQHRIIISKLCYIKTSNITKGLSFN